MAYDPWAGFGGRAAKPKRGRPGRPQPVTGSWKQIAATARIPRMPSFGPGFGQTMTRANFFGGGQNDYAGLIGGSPDLSELEALYGAQSKADAASRDAALRRLAISYGGDINLDNLGISDAAKGFLKKALDAKTLELAHKAEQEGVSIHARQAHDDSLTRRRIPAVLAGRGMLRSGQTGADLGEQAQSYKNLQYDTLNELLGNVEGTVGGFLQAERDRAMALAQARIQAAWDAMQNWGDSYGLGGPDWEGAIAAGGTRPKTTRPGRVIRYGAPRGRGGAGGSVFRSM